MDNCIRTGTVEGTGAVIAVELGFTPDYVRLINVDDAGNLAPTLEWCHEHGSGQGVLTLKSVDSGATGNASSAEIAANGITPKGQVEGDTYFGFQIGTDANINAAGETIFYLAIRTGTGA